MHVNGQGQQASPARIAELSPNTLQVVRGTQDVPSQVSLRRQGAGLELESRIMGLAASIRL
jgi:hypothetical protein